MKIISRLGKSCGRFRAEAKKYGCSANPLMFVHGLFLKKKYRVERSEYFEHGLYRLFADHSDYYSRNKIWNRGWKCCRPIYAGDKGLAWRVIRRIDFGISKRRYPGLDARDYLQYEFWKFGHAKRKSFVTEGYLQFLVNTFNKRSEMSILSDKSKFKAYFPEFTDYKWITSMKMDMDAFEAFCEGLDRVIVKPLKSSQGRRIFVADVRTAEERTRLFNDVAGKDCIIEEVIVQHPDIASLNPSSVNTVRVFSVYKDGETFIAGTVLRMGAGGMVIDNYSSGGMVAALDPETGVVISSAIDKKGCRYDVHPHTAAAITGFRVPCWDKIISAVKAAHPRIPDLRYVGWDVVLTSSCGIVFLEGNGRGGVTLQQLPMMTGVKDIYDRLL